MNQFPLVSTLSASIAKAGLNLGPRLVAHILALILSLSANAGEPQLAPIPIIEAGGHTNDIDAVSCDASGTLALSASNDKTARLWKLDHSGKGPFATLVRVLRPPIGWGMEGQLYAG